MRRNHAVECCKGQKPHKRCELDSCDRCFTCVRHYLYGSTQRDGFGELWPLWVKRWGKLQAADAVVAAMGDFEARYNDLRRLVAELRKAKKKK